jgi:hypothetical protein
MTSGKQRKIGYIDCNLFEFWEHFENAFDPREEPLDSPGLVRFPVEGYRRTVWFSPDDIDYISLPTHTLEAHRTESFDDGLTDDNAVNDSEMGKVIKMARKKRRVK